MDELADTITADVAIIGAGIAGAGLAADLAGDFEVVLLEQESRPGYHSTGRSAAIFIQNYGNAAIRALTRASWSLFSRPDATLFPMPLVSQRGLLYVAGEEGLAQHAALMAEGEDLRELSLDEARTMVPLLRPEWLRAAAYEHDAQDIDVAALHQGWLKKAKGSGTRIITDAGLAAARPDKGRWHVETRAGVVNAGIVVNAAGAWADTVANVSGVSPLGIQPMRRTMAVLPVPPELDVARWPLISDSAEGWYAKPEAGRLQVSPDDEDPVDAHDAFVDDMVLAEGLYRFEQAMDFPVTRVETSWAGLRSFAPDRTPVAGFDRTAEGFFWLAGQGGYGIQTSPALSRLAGQLIRRASMYDDLAGLASALSPNRFRN
jgi:D-arginine dehydrogenase